MRPLRTLLVPLVCVVTFATSAPDATAFPAFARTDYPTPPSPSRMASGDLNGDGIPDLAVGCQSDPNPVISVYLGNADGTLGARADYATGLNPTAVAIADFNRDGVPDLAAALHLVNSAAVLLGHGDGTFGVSSQFAVGSFPIDVAVADFNRDGNPDLAVTNSEDNTISILLGNGDGSFQPQRVLSDGGFPEGIVAADVNGDGNPDLVTAAFTSHAIHVQIGNGDGTFTSRPLQPLMQINPIDLAAADWNGDGPIDVAIVNRGSGSVSVLLGAGDGTFANQQNYTTGTNPLGIDAADFDADGRLDLAVTGQDASVVSLFPGVGDGTFGTRTDVPTGAGPVAVCTADWNRDGHVDLATSNAAPNVNTASVLLSLGGDLPARAYVVGSNKTIRLNSKWCAEIEPIGAAFAVTQIVPGSIELISAGTGSVSRISAINQTMMVGDRDHNGIQDVEVCFRKEDLRLLFASVQGKRTLPVAIEGVVSSGRRFHASMQVTVDAGGPSQAASITIGPGNLEAGLSFVTWSAGTARVTLFDVRGAQVGVLMDRTWVPSGIHRIPWDGRDAQGSPLAAGVYFYRIESVSGVTTGRAILVR